MLKASGLEKVFFTNSGTEAIEGALKAAKKYAYIRDGHSGHEIIAMNHSFHGRTIGALSVTGNAHYRDPFAPLMDGVKFADFNDINSVKEKITEKTCAILLEPVQGEGGIFPAEQDFLDELRQICDEKDILLIFDEIQCGMGRTGNYFAWQAYGIKSGYNDLCQSTWMRSSGRRFCSWEKGGEGFACSGRPWHDVVEAILLYVLQ